MKILMDTRAFSDEEVANIQMSESYKRLLAKFSAQNSNGEEVKNLIKEGMPNLFLTVRDLIDIGLVHKQCIRSSDSDGYQNAEILAHVHKVTNLFQERILADSTTMDSKDLLTLDLKRLADPDDLLLNKRIDTQALFTYNDLGHNEGQISPLGGGISIARHSFENRNSTIFFTDRNISPEPTPVNQVFGKIGIPFKSQLK